MGRIYRESHARAGAQRLSQPRASHLPLQIHPLVRELAAIGARVRVPVAVTCRVLKIARQPYYRWLATPVTTAELEQAYRANALHNAHLDDPEFGYRYLVIEAASVGEPMAERTAGRCARR